MMFLATSLGEVWANFWDPIHAVLESSDMLQAVGGIMGMIGVPGLLIFYFKYIAPRLAKANFINKQFNDVVALVGRLEAKLDKAVGINLNLKQDLLTLRDAFGIAFKNSKLTQHAKDYLTEVLAGIREGRKVDPTEFLEDATEETKQAVKEFVETAETMASEKRVTALQQLEDMVKEATTQEEESLDTENATQEV